MDTRVGSAGLRRPEANPLLGPWEGPFGLPPFAAIRPEHYAPAFEIAMAEHRAEVEAIASNRTVPTFENAVAALDGAGRLLERIGGVFHNLAASETSAPLQAVELEMAPRLAAHQHGVLTHRALFERLDAVHETRDRLGLAPEERRLVERLHTDFVRAGARLDGAGRERLAQIVERLAELMTRFAQNVLAEEAAFGLVLNDEEDLAGLPPFVCAAARHAGVERGIDACVVTLARSQIVPFLTLSDRRDLREQAWRAWTGRGEHPGAHDNRPLAREILSLRHEQAQLLGHACFADHALGDSMARTRSNVTDLLQQVWQPARRRALAEREALEAMAVSRDEPAQIEPWDWRYYAEKVRRVRYRLDEVELKPFFALERMVAAAFDCAERLFGVTFAELPGTETYHPDVKLYEVRDAGETPIGAFLHDNHARPTKRSGAWMSVYRSQSKRNGVRVLPIVVNNNNFAQATPGEPTLLSLDDARTLFHEFGHALHALLSDVTYERLSGTRVLRDFVELPSQLFEHWLDEPQVLERHARHHVTGVPIPGELIERLHAARHFSEGYESVRYVASAWVDLAVHALPAVGDLDIVAFEEAELARLGLPHGAGVNHRLSHFQHLFAGSDYAAGYYVYLWAEVLDADAFDAFVEAGDPFDRGVAARLRRSIYGVGDSVDPAEAYRRFRGRDPHIGPMLRRRGLLDEPAP